MKIIGLIIFFAFVALIISYEVMKALSRKMLDKINEDDKGMIKKEVKDIVFSIVSASEENFSDDGYQKLLGIRFFRMISILRSPVALQEALVDLLEEKKEIATKIFWQACNRCSAEIWTYMYFQAFEEKYEKIAALREIINLLNLDLKEKVLVKAYNKFNDYKKASLANYEAEDDIEAVNVEIMYIIGAMPNRRAWLEMENH